MSDDIYGILQRLAVIEGNVTPATVKKGLNPQQKSVPQLPALFHPRKTSPVLGAKKDPKHPTVGYMVGDDVEVGQVPLAEAMAGIEEDMISKVKKDLTHYLDQLADRAKTDQDLKDKAVKSIEDPNPAEPNNQEKEVEEMHGSQGQISTIPEPVSSPVKTVPLEDGSVLEIHGDQRQGFTVRNGGRVLKTKFSELDEAQMAIELYRANRKPVQTSSQDYVDEA